MTNREIIAAFAESVGYEPVGFKSGKGFAYAPRLWGADVIKSKVCFVWTRDYLKSAIEDELSRAIKEVESTAQYLKWVDFKKQIRNVTEPAQDSEYYEVTLVRIGEKG